MYRSGRFASRQRNWLLALTVFMTLLAGGSATQAQTLFTVTGDVATPLELSAADLAGMPREKATLEHDGQTQTYEGVLLYDVLVKAGVPFGKAMTGKPMASYLLLTGRDGYQVVFALPELDPKFAGAKVLLADKRDGAALPANELPLRIVAPQDKMHARSIYSVVKAEVVRLRK
jgi:DMSO/TMAO reductase YedYZ molybdopterin-dependent catalytic subunit